MMEKIESLDKKWQILILIILVGLSFILGRLVGKEIQHFGEWLVKYYGF